MICLSDNDVIHKLAACDLLDETMAVLGVGFGDVYVLPTAKYKFGIRKDPGRAEKRYGAAVFGRIRDFLAQVQEIAVEPDLADVQLLAAIEGIDAGEVVLFTTATRMDQAVLATGDKRSLRALATTAACRPVALRLAGRVFSLEQIVKKVIQHCGFEPVKGKILLGRDSDTALRAAFGSGEQATEANVLDCLDSYIRELRSLPVNLLVE